MADDQEKREREDRAKRLRQARVAAKFRGPKAVAEALKIKVDAYKAHEQGRNGFTVSDGRRYARLFGVSIKWLYLNMGEPTDADLSKAAPQLRDAFLRLAEAPAPVQEQIVSYVQFELGRLEQSREIATSPTS